MQWDEVGKSISWLEALHLVKILMRDPRSWTQAAMNGWQYPVSTEWILLAELFDLTHQVNSKKKIKPLARPWPNKNVTHTGKTIHSRADVIRNLNRMNNVANTQEK